MQGRGRTHGAGGPIDGNMFLTSTLIIEYRMEGEEREREREREIEGYISVKDIPDAWMALATLDFDEQAGGGLNFRAVTVC